MPVFKIRIFLRSAISFDLIEVTSVTEFNGGFVVLNTGGSAISGG